MTRLKSFSISLHGTVPMKVGAVLFIRGGRRISISRYGSCETSRTEDSEGTERHLETPISLNGKKRKKEEPKTNNRLCLVFVLGSYWRRWGNAIHVHNILYSLRWQYYITEILPYQHILPAHPPTGITLPLAFSSASPPRSRRSRCLA